MQAGEYADEWVNRGVGLVGQSMKVKQRPEDFRVEEMTARSPGDAGDFAFYRLEKTGWTTHDALAALRGAGSSIFSA